MRGILFTILISLGILGTPSPVVSGPLPPTTYTAEVKDVMLYLHIDFEKGAWQDIISMRNDESGPFFFTRGECIFRKDYEAQKMLYYLAMNSAPVKNVIGYCFNDEEYVRHVETHPSDNTSDGPSNRHLQNLQEI